MRRLSTVFGLLLVAVVGLSAPAGAQAQEPLQVGAVAPEFSLPGATRHGVLLEPVTLSEYSGQTVVLAFFFRARTKG